MSRTRIMTWLTTALLVAAIVLLLVNRIQQPKLIAVAEGTQESGSRAALQHLSLEEMTDRAGRIFRGTIIDFNPGTVEVGGGELPVISYKVRVDQILKGEFERKGDVAFVEITMLGNIKGEVPNGSLQRMTFLPSPSRLRVGGEYLLMMTPESPVGLSTTVGLGQGSFEISLQDKQEWANNEFNNVGLFNGPVAYDTLAEQIRQQVGR